MGPDYRNMFCALVAMQSAAFGAALATGGRCAEFALRQTGLGVQSAFDALRAPAGMRQRAWEDAMQCFWEQDMQAARLIAGLPRLWTMLFLGELDRIRGPRAAPPAGDFGAGA